MKSFIAVLAAAAIAHAQDSSMSMSASEVSASASISLVAGESFSMSTMMSAEPSAAASAGPSGLPVTSNTSYAYECQAGNSLTYAIVNATFTGVDLQTAVEYFSDWTMSAPGEIVNSTGTNMTGDMRTYSPPGAEYNISQILSNSTIDMMTGALQQTFNLTEPYSPSTDLTISAAYYDLQVYESDQTMETTLQYFVNACTNNQEALLLSLPTRLQDAINYWQMELQNATESGSSMSMMSSMSMSSMDAVESASSAASSAFASITEAPAAGASSLFDGATSAVLPSLRARAVGRWA